MSSYQKLILNLPCTLAGVAVMAGSAVLVTVDEAATRTATECITVVFVVLEAAENSLKGVLIFRSVAEDGGVAVSEYRMTQTEE